VAWPPAPREPLRPAPRNADGTELGQLTAYVRQLSGGNVRKISASGPVIAPGQHRRRLRYSTFRYVLPPADRALIAGLTTAWLICVANFWVWWLQPSHRLGLLGLVLNSLVLLYVSGYPVFFVVGINRLRNTSGSVTVPLLRVAFVVTRAPSEPWDVARATLAAMLDQDYPIPYDVWLCDERPTDEIMSWCRWAGVIVASRDGVPEYHRATWPRRTRCKEGNLAYFYDHWGYREYDVVAQLDCDHVPARTYLAEMVRPFADPGIGYVAAPSVCDANADASWSARGRLYREATFHGAFQLGHSDGWGPLCIGSHYAVRTEALRDIGGIGPELAEDFATSYLLNTAGWHGAFAINAEAHGDGPNTFPTMVVQEFQWSRSLTTVLLGLVPRNLGRLPWRLRFRFLYALSYYTLLVTTTLAGVLLAPVADITGHPWINVNYVDFLLHWWIISIWLVLMAFLLRRRGLFRPYYAPIFSWENFLYTVTRWPYIAWGIGSGIGQRIRPRNVTFKVTPKGAGGLEVFPARLIVPFVLISVACSGSALLGEQRPTTSGYAFLSLLGAFVYAVVSVLVPVLHAREAARAARVGTLHALWRASRFAVALGLLTFLPIALAALRYPPMAFHGFINDPNAIPFTHWRPHWQSW
jgi:cellulose synthase/poly-beta-1,6-N-acetylglucosamine synthase-like glycosyltransferase